MNSWPLRLASVFGFSAVLLGAFGAHGLKPLLETNGTTAIWQTAVDYHFYHAVALLAIGAFSAETALRLRPVVWFWTVGIWLFSGSLYLLAVTNARWLGAVTPIGGTLFLLGWGMLFLRTLRSASKTP